MTVSCDYDPATLYVSRKIKAAKPHKCSECRGVIQKNESHELVKGLWDGRWESFRTCPDCLHLRCSLQAAYGEGGCNGWLHSGMIDMLEGMACDLKWSPADKTVKERQFIAMFNATSKLRGGHVIITPVTEE